MTDPREPVEDDEPGLGPWLVVSVLLGLVVLVIVVWLIVQLLTGVAARPYS